MFDEIIVHSFLLSSCTITHVDKTIFLTQVLVSDTSFLHRF